MLRIWLPCALLVPFALEACGSDNPAPEPDTGVKHDAAARDAEPQDAPNPDAEHDAGVVDTGLPDTGIDAGPLPDGGGGGRLPLGTATAMQSMNCGNTAVPTTSCLRLNVTCNGIADMPVDLKVTDPTTAIKGTVVLGSGGDGGGFFEMAFGQIGTDHILQPLVSMGYRVVQRAWRPGWTHGPGGGALEGCRPATMFDWIYRNIHHQGDGAFCASGNSGGSAEISYTLTNYGLERIFDLANPTSGPPLGRIDYGCLGSNNQAWLDHCHMIHVSPTATCVYTQFGYDIVNNMYQNMDCQNHNAALEQTFYNDSVLNPMADLDYPNTEVRFVFGGMDTSEAVPLGRVYAEAITSAKTVTIVPNAGHILPQDPTAADQILMDIMEGCVFRH